VRRQARRALPSAHLLASGWRDRRCAGRRGELRGEWRRVRGETRCGKPPCLARAGTSRGRELRPSTLLPFPGFRSRGVLADAKRRGARMGCRETSSGMPTAPWSHRAAGSGFARPPSLARIGLRGTSARATQPSQARCLLRGAIARLRLEARARASVRARARLRASRGARAGLRVSLRAGLRAV
jgi:hypothetical protein